VSDRATAWSTRFRRPPFLLFQLFDAHILTSRRVAAAGYLDDPRARARIATPRARASYDAEISTPTNFGRVIDRLVARPLDEALIVVTADHGERREHSLYGHPARLYEELTRIPLIVSFRSAAIPGRARHADQLVDLFALILDQAGVETPPGIQDSSGTHRHPIFTERPRLQRQGCARSTRIEKLLGSGGTRQLYDLARDPKEERDWQRAPDGVAELGGAAARVATLPAPSAFEAERRRSRTGSAASPRLRGMTGDTGNPRVQARPAETTRGGARRVRIPSVSCSPARFRSSTDRRAPPLRLVAKYSRGFLRPEPATSMR
jgi:hypothetical protein